jgi:hypothetical protein
MLRLGIWSGPVAPLEVLAALWIGGVVLKVSVLEGEVEFERCCTRGDWRLERG